MERCRFRVFRLLTGLALFAILLGGCESGTPHPGNNIATPGIIKIGAELPLVGDDASAGKAAEDGIRLAIDEANRQHILSGYTLMLDAKNDSGASGMQDPSVGAVNVMELISDAQVAGIVGPLANNVAKAEIPLTNQKGIAQISPANTASCLTQSTLESGCTGPNNLIPLLRPTGRVTYFRLATPDNSQGALTADFAYRTLGYRRVVVIDDTEANGADLASNFINQFTSDDGRVVDHVYLQGRSDYAAELQKIALLRPDAIYFAGQNANAGSILRRQMEATPGLETTPLLIGDALIADAIVRAGGPASAGSVYGIIASADAIANPSATAFVQKYQSMYGAIGPYSASSYDSAWILINAVKAAISAGAKPPTAADDSDAASSFRQAVISALMKTDYDGVTGHQSFDLEGDTMNRVISVYQITDAADRPSWKYIGSESSS
jgi:branched-chain amino acid transport system substrate-binding protein